MSRTGARNRLGHVPRPGHSRGLGDPRKSPEYRAWRVAVIARDGRCVRCGETRANLLTADHIVKWADDPSKRLAVSNGQTLCERCHQRKNGATRNWSKATKAKMRQAGIL